MITVIVVSLSSCTIFVVLLRERTDVRVLEKRLIDGRLVTGTDYFKNRFGEVLVRAPSDFEVNTKP